MGYCGPMTDLDRRSFLKGLLAATAVAAVGIPAVAKAASKSPPYIIGIDHALGPDVSKTVFFIDGVGVVPGDQMRIGYNGGSGHTVYEVVAIHDNGQEVTLARVHHGKVTDHRMPMSDLEDYLNREVEVATRPIQAEFRISSEPSRPAKATRPRKTWPTPRRPHRR